MQQVNVDCPVSYFLVGTKTTDQFFLKFNMTFLATWGCASDFYPPPVEEGGF